MADRQEGVIKFQLVFRPAPPLLRCQVRALNRWRQKLYRARLIGQDPARYGGEAYGNISCRLGPLDRPGARRRFIISGTQTGRLPELDETHYALVTVCHPERNLVVAEGPIRPSSEAMTHGTIYQLADAVRYVMHVHSPEIWGHADELDLPQTKPDVAYGTPEMAEEVRRLFRETRVAEAGLFVMGGHEDGIVAFGATAEAAGRIMEHWHARACRRTHCDFIMQA